MDMPATLFPTQVLVVFAILFLSILYIAAVRASWRNVIELSAIAPAAVALLSVIWTIRAEVVDGQSFHFLGVTLLTLIFGWRLALFAATIVVAVTCFRLGLGWWAIPVNTLIMGGIPVAVTSLLLHCSERYLPPNLFVYIFIPAFLGGILSLLLVVLAGSLLMYLVAGIDGHTLRSQYLIFAPLMMLPEGTVNGMIVSIFVAFFPQWLLTFRDSHYLGGR